MSDEFYAAANKIEEKIKLTNNISHTLLNTSSPFIISANSADFLQEKEKYLKIFADILANNKGIYSVYIGFNDGSFYEIINLKINDILGQTYASSNADKWLEIIVQNDSKQTNTYDVNFNLISQKEIDNDYIVKSRPWYIKATQENNIIKVGPYRFSNINSDGVTYALNIANDNVLALDILTSDLSSTLKNYNKNKLLKSQLVNQRSEVIASSTPDTKIFDAIKHSINSITTPQSEQDTISISGEKYLYSIAKIDSFGTDEYLLSYVSLDKMMSPYLEEFAILNKTFVVVFLLFLPLIWYFSSIIVKPILLLVQESEKVKNREFSKIAPVKTIVNEVRTLSKSMVSMAESINEYQTELEEKVRNRTKALEKTNKELKILSITDKLTNTYNRIKLDATMEKKIKAKTPSFGVIMIDIDYFKKINDTYGHQIGDYALIEFADILKTGADNDTILGRWGGEEFMMISSLNSLTAMLELAEQLRLKIDQHKFTYIGHKTASFGVSQYRAGDSAESLIKRADEALYIAKEKGRNNVVSIDQDS
jgi:diguanylate cyclase (GGDEF)-like protein